MLVAITYIYIYNNPFFIIVDCLLRHFQLAFAFRLLPPPLPAFTMPDACSSPRRYCPPDITAACREGAVKRCPYIMSCTQQQPSILLRGRRGREHRQQSAECKTDLRSAGGARCCRCRGCRDAAVCPRRLRIASSALNQRSTAPNRRHYITPRRR